MSDPDIFLLSTERMLDTFDLPEESDNVFFVNNGVYPLQGKRFRNVYVDYMCYKDPNYEECIGLFIRNRSLMEDRGSMFLI